MILRSTLQKKKKLSCKDVVAKVQISGSPLLLTNLKKTVIDPASFRSLLKFSVGIQLFSGNHNCPDCGTAQDNFGYHATSCKVASGAIDKHNSIVESIFLNMRSAAINCSKESVNIGDDSNRQRPGDVYMPDFDIYGEAYFDVSVINPCATSYINRASQGILEASKIRYDQKTAKYCDLGPKMKPLVVEATGGWHPYSFNYLKTISEHIATRTNKCVTATLNLLLTEASFCLQRHQGNMLVRRCLGL